MATNDEQKEIRGQRHDFIKEYYKMATLDLDRHLKAGWQAIAVLAGGAAILTAGHDGKIGMPIATAIALSTAFWGALSVIDANYWSLRAIGFLANVEAVYFSAEDRTAFNPYIGYHPPYKLLNSLQYMFWLCLAFGAASLLSMIWEITRYYPSISIAWRHLRTLQALPLFLWCLPLLVTLWGGLWLHIVWRKRLQDYVDFSRESPGPGVRLTTATMRHVTLEPINGKDAQVIEMDSQKAMLTKLDARNTRLKRLAWIPWSVAIIPSIVLAFAVISEL